ncbi:MAG: hypothetical protein V4596_05115 [Bdellovibrionota bacterium]
MASLIACLGIQFDLGKKDWDRLSAPLNVKIGGASNLWKSKLISFKDEIGLCLWSSEIDEFKPDHIDLKYILHPLSLDENHKLSRLIIFPNLIAQHYRKLGINLVIVKKWALSSFLAEAKNTTNYLLTNELEMTNGTPLIQAQLMATNQLAFQGTHDLADHLLGANRFGLERNQSFYALIHDKMEKALLQEHSRPNIMRVLAYLMGVILDDMAQPIWYNSEKHYQTLKKALNNFENLEKFSSDKADLSLPPSFHALVSVLRDNKFNAEPGEAYDNFIKSLCYLCL